MSDTNLTAEEQAARDAFDAIDQTDFFGALASLAIEGRLLDNERFTALKDAVEAHLGTSFSSAFSRTDAKDDFEAAMNTAGLDDEDDLGQFAAMLRAIDATVSAGGGKLKSTDELTIESEPVLERTRRELGLDEDDDPTDELSKETSDAVWAYLRAWYPGVKIDGELLPAKALRLSDFTAAQRQQYGLESEDEIRARGGARQDEIVIPPDTTGGGEGDDRERQGGTREGAITKLTLSGGMSPEERAEIEAVIAASRKTGHNRVLHEAWSSVVALGFYLVEVYELLVTDNDTDLKAGYEELSWRRARSPLRTIVLDEVYGDDAGEHFLADRELMFLLDLLKWLVEAPEPTRASAFRKATAPAAPTKEEKLDRLEGLIGLRLEGLYAQQYPHLDLPPERRPASEPVYDDFDEEVEEEDSDGDSEETDAEAAADGEPSEGTATA